MPSFSLVPQQPSPCQIPTNLSLHDWLSAAGHLGVFPVNDGLRIPMGRADLTDNLHRTLAEINKRMVAIGNGCVDMLHVEEQRVLHVPEEATRMINGSDAVILMSMISQMARTVIMAQHVSNEPRPAKICVRPATVGLPALKLAGAKV